MGALAMWIAPQQGGKPVEPGSSCMLMTSRGHFFLLPRHKVALGVVQSLVLGVVHDFVEVTLIPAATGSYFFQNLHKSL